MCTWGALGTIATAGGRKMPPWKTRQKALVIFSIKIKIQTFAWCYTSLVNSSISLVLPLTSKQNKFL